MTSGLPWPADTSTPAVVLKLDPNVFHHGGLGVIRSLGRLGVPVHVVHEDLLAPAAVSRYVAGRWRWNPGGDDGERIAAGLVRLAEHIGGPAVLIPTDDAGAIFLAEQGHRLRGRFHLPTPQATLPRRVAAKRSLAELCRQAPIGCPEIILPRSLAEAHAFVDRVGLPVFAKLDTPWRRPDGAWVPSTALVTSRQRLAALFPAHAAGTRAPVLLQESVPGDGGADWFFHAYCDARSQARPAFTGVKERSYPPRAGLTTLGRAVHNERLAGEVSKLLTELGYRGLVDLDLRYDTRDDRFKLLDFNPRVGAQFRLFENSFGLDVVRAAYLDLTGQPAPDYALDQTGGPGSGRGSGRGSGPGGDAAPSWRCFLVENYDLLAALGYRRRGELDLRGWVRSWRAVDETAWFARDDLAPFGLMCLRLGWRLLQRPLHAGPPRPDRRPPRYRPGRATRQDGPARPAIRSRVAGRRSEY